MWAECEGGITHSLQEAMRWRVSGAVELISAARVATSQFATGSSARCLWQRRRSETYTSWKRPVSYDITVPNQNFELIQNYWIIPSPNMELAATGFGTHSSRKLHCTHLGQFRTSSAKTGTHTNANGLRSPVSRKVRPTTLSSSVACNVATTLLCICSLVCFVRLFLTAVSKTREDNIRDKAKELGTIALHPVRGLRVADER